MTAASLGRTARRWSRPGDEPTRTDDRRGIRERERLGVVEDPDRRRVQHRREENRLVERILGVLASRSTPGEERLQRLRGEMHDPIAVDPPDPPALQRVADG